MTEKPVLTESEELILHSQGAYRSRLRSGWKPGHYSLTDQRLLFSQPAGILFQTPLNHITAVTLERHMFVLRTTNVLCICYRDTRTERASKAWIVMRDLESWRKKIHELTAPKIEEETVKKVAEGLEPESREILWTIWQNRHANIDELAELIAAPNHMDVLLKIKNIINPRSEKITGRPILTFERSKIDDGTGEKILFSWWIMGEREEPRIRKREMPIDVFDEGDHVNIIMDLMGLQEKDVSLKVERNKLTVLSRTAGKTFQEEIYLPAEVHPDKTAKNFNNNILRVILHKR